VPSKQTLQWKFTFQCQSKLVVKNDPTKTTCEGLALGTISYVLVKDTFDGVPCKKQSIGKCKALFDGAERNVDASTDIVLPGADGLVNGGFVTKANLATALRGPDNLAQNPNMMIVLTNGESYQYFNVDAKVAVTMYLTDDANVLEVPSEAGDPVSAAAD
jgi:hypothetical protein